MSRSSGPGPRLLAVIQEQVAVVGLAVRREAIGFAVLVSAIVGLTILDALRLTTRVSLGDLDALGLIAGAVGFFFPFAVWKGERLSSESLLWTLPVDHATHLLVKVGAGWAWLILLICGGVGLSLLLPVLTGGAIGLEETRLVLDASSRAGVETITWSRPTWKWLTLLGGSTALYLLASTLVLAVPHQWRLGVGAVVAFGVVLSIVLLSIGELVPTWAISPVRLVMDPLLFGRYGLDVLLTGGSEALTTPHSMPSGEDVLAWRSLPSFRRWVVTGALWSGTGLVALTVAAWRHRES